MTMRFARAIAAVCTAAILASCSGTGGSSGSAAVPPAVPLPSAAPPSRGATTVSIAMQIAGSAEHAAAMIERRASGRRASPMYVSTSTLGVEVIVYPHGSTTAIATDTFNVSAGSSICTAGSPRTCSLTLDLQPGTYDFTMRLYDAVPVSGAIPTSAKLLSVGTLTNQTIQAYHPNSLAFVVDGVVASVGSIPTFATVPADGSPHAVAISFVAADADGNPITGSQPYAYPIAVSLTESGGGTSGHTHLTVNGANVGTSTTITAPGDSLALVYDGGGSPGYSTVTTIGSATAPTQALRVSPMYLSTTNVSATDADQSNTVTISEVGAPTTSYANSGWSCSGFSAAVSNAGSGTGSVSVTSPQAVAGNTLMPSYSCGAMTVTDAYGTSRTISVGASIPVTQTCASAGANVYLGARSGSSYEVASGSPCGLVVSGSDAECVGSGTVNCLIFAPPNTASYPGSGSVSVAEANDTKALTIAASTCSSVAGVYPSLSPGAALTASATGSVGFSSTYAVGPCAVKLSDGNGQTETVNVTVDPPVNVPSTSPVSVSVTVTCQYDTLAQTIVCHYPHSTATIGTMTSVTNTIVLDFSNTAWTSTNPQYVSGAIVGACMKDTTTNTLYSYTGSGLNARLTLPAGTANDTWLFAITVMGTNTNGTSNGTATTGVYGSMYNGASNTGSATLTQTTTC